jgi:hypothetical protein
LLAPGRLKPTISGASEGVLSGYEQALAVSL